MSVISSAVVPYAVFERIKRDTTKFGFVFYENTNPKTVDPADYELLILDGAYTVAVLSCTQTASNRIEAVLTTAAKASLSKNRYSLALVDTTSGQTQLEGILAWLSGRRTSQGIQTPPDILIRYTTSSSLPETIQSVIQGPQGYQGWSMVLSNVQDGERVVQQVTDWIGGEGVKPASGQYLGNAGLVSNIVQARNIRGRGFWPRGAWQANTVYALDDIVTFQNSTYRRTNAGNSGSSFDATNWELWALGLNFRGTWQASTAYSVNDLITFQGTTYRRINAGTSGTTFNRSEWERWAQGTWLRGAWQASTQYFAGDIVTRNGASWIRNADGISGASFDPANWTQITRGINPRGPWQASTTYQADDLVYAQGATYRCLTDHTSPASFAQGSLWELFSAQGNPADMTRTSPDNRPISPGNVTFSFAQSANLGWTFGMRLRATVTGSPGLWVEGVVTAVSSNSVTLAVDQTSGAGNYSNWSIGVAGQIGPQGLLTPGFIAENTSYTVPDSYQQSSNMNIVVEGTLIIDGYLTDL